MERADVFSVLAGFDLRVKAVVRENLLHARHGVALLSVC
jgi:hypothetical protein